MKTAVILFGFAMMWAMTPGAGRCANVIGSVQNEQGRPVNDVVISARNSAGMTMSQGTTNPQGKYEIFGLAPGKYDFNVNPGKSGLKSGTAVSYLNQKGLTINWRLSPVDPPLASAREGAELEVAGDPFGFSAGEFASLVVLAAGGIAGGVVGGYGAAGGFSSSSAPASPSL